MADMGYGLNYDMYRGLSPGQVASFNGGKIPDGWDWGKYQGVQTPQSGWGTGVDLSKEIAGATNYFDRIAAQNATAFGGRDPWSFMGTGTNPAAAPAPGPSMGSQPVGAPPSPGPSMGSRNLSDYTLGLPPAPTGGPINAGRTMINLKGGGAAPYAGGAMAKDPGAPQFNQSTGQWMYPSATGGWTPGAPPANIFSGQPGDPFGGTSAAGNENRTASRSGLDPRLDSMLQYGLGEALSRYLDPNGRRFYQGQTVAGLTPDEIAAQGMLRGAAGRAEGAATNGMSFLDQLLANAQNPGQNAQVDNAVGATLHDVVRNTMDPGGPFSQIRDNALGTGTYGGTRQGVLEGITAGRLMDSLGRTSADMRLSARNSDINAGLQGVNSTPAFSGLNTLPASYTAAIGSQNRAQDQAVMDDALRRWGYDTTIGDTRLSNLMNTINAAPLGGWNANQSWLSQAALNQGGTSTGQNVAGGLAAGGALWQILRNAGII